jgi:hypothetical protein
MAIAADHVTIGVISTGVPQTVTSSTGNLSVVILWLNTAGVVTSITDNKGNTYLLAIQNGTQSCWYAPGSATGITAIIVNFTGGGVGEAGFYDCSGAHAVNPLVNADYMDLNTTSATTNPIGPTSNYPIGGGIAISLIVGGTVSAVASPFTLDNTANAGIAHNAFASAGIFAPSWTTLSGQWSGIIVVFASSTGTSNIRFAKSKNASVAGTFTTTNPITTAVGDLVCVIGTSDAGKSGTFSDSFSNTYLPVTGMNPYSGTAGDFDVYASYCVLPIAKAGNSHTFNFNYTADGGPVLLVMVITPSVAPTINAHGVGTTSSANVNHVAATCTPTATDFLIAACTSGNPYLTLSSFTANGLWSLGVFELDSNFYKSAAIEYQLSAAGGSTHDDVTTSGAVESNEVIFSFLLPSGSVTVVAPYSTLGEDYKFGFSETAF